MLRVTQHRHAPRPVATLIDAHAMLHRIHSVWRRLEPQPPQEHFLRGMVPRYIKSINTVLPADAALAPFLRTTDGSPRPRVAYLCLDQGGRAYARNAALPEYKANREPDAVRDAFIRLGVQEVRAAQGVHVLPPLSMPEVAVEGDDVIAGLIDEARRQRLPCLVASHDKDLFQLVNDRHSVAYYHLGTKSFVDEQAVERLLGVRPAQVCDYLALLGDKVDNVPGVPRVGTKRAAQLLNAHGSLDAVLQAAAAGEVKPGLVRRSLIEHGPRVTLMRDSVLALRPPDWSARFVGRAVPAHPEVPLRDISHIPLPDSAWSRTARRPGRPPRT